MAEYSEIPDLIKDFKRAAIDAYMRTLPYAWSIEGDHYEISSSSTNTKVTRPGADGEGGGDWSSNNFIANMQLFRLIFAHPCDLRALPQTAIF
jgi:hypothetical protein